MRIVLNHRAVLVGAVVVGGDRTGAVVHPRAHGGVAQVSEVVGLGALAQSGVFHLDKVADVRLTTEGQHAHAERDQERVLPVRRVRNTEGGVPLGDAVVRQFEQMKI